MLECVEARSRVKEQWQRAACRAVADGTAEPSVLWRSRKRITWHGQLREIDAEAKNLTEDAQTLVAKAQEQLQVAQRAMFHRGRTGATLTAAGERLLPYAIKVTHLLEEAQVNRLGNVG